MKRILSMFLLLTLIIVTFQNVAFAENPFITEPNSVISGALEKDDAIIYQIILPQNCVFTITGTSLAFSDFSITLLEHNNNIIDSDNSYVDWTKNGITGFYDISFSHQLIAGTYYIKIINNLDNVLTYNLNLNFSTPKKIGAIANLKNSITRNVVDLYYFTLSNTSTINISGESANDSNFTIYIINSKGSEVTKDSFPDWTNQSISGLEKLNMVRTLTKGTYYIKIANQVNGSSVRVN